MTNITSTRLCARSAARIGVLLVLISAACGDDEGSKGSIESADSAEGGAAAGSSASPSDLLKPPAAGRGEQLTMQSEIAAGDERENCMFVRTHGPLIVNHDEVRFTTGSHHVLLYMTDYRDLPSEDLEGNAVDTSKVFDCSDGVQGKWKLNGLLSASQSAKGQSATSFPEGVGVRVPGDTWLLFNVHYINPSDHKLETKVAVNLHSIPESELKEEGGLLFWYNPFLKVPASGHSTMTASCPLPDDIHLTNVQSHMHRRGVGYSATLISPDDARSEIYTNDSWENVPVKAFSPNLDIASGSRLEWSCDYTNTENHDIYQGSRSTDEMCMLIGSYYPRDDRTGFCMRDKQAFFGAQWSIGQGSASCGDSLGCFSKVGESASDGKDQIAKLTECLMAAEPSVSAPLSSALGCLIAAGEDGIAACGSEIADCMSAK